MMGNIWLRSIVCRTEPSSKVCKNHHSTCRKRWQLFIWLDAASKLYMFRGSPEFTHCIINGENLGSFIDMILYNLLCFLHYAIPIKSYMNILRLFRMIARKKCFLFVSWTGGIHFIPRTAYEMEIWATYLKSDLGYKPMTICMPAEWSYHW